MREMERFVDILANNLAYMKRKRSRRSLTLSPYSLANENVCKYISASLISQSHSVSF